MKLCNSVFEIVNGVKQIFWAKLTTSWKAPVACQKCFEHESILQRPVKKFFCDHEDLPRLGVCFSESLLGSVISIYL